VPDENECDPRDGRAIDWIRAHVRPRWKMLDDCAGALSYGNLGLGCSRRISRGMPLSS
jgi:hypothetical protein